MLHAKQEGMKTLHVELDAEVTVFILQKEVDPPWIVACMILDFSESRP